MNKSGLLKSMAWTLAVTNIVTLAMPINVYANASTNFDLRKKVIGISGITTINGDLTNLVTRAEFARMLVLASAYRSVLTSTSNVSVFADVASGNEYASAIRIAAEQGWMTAYLGGYFKPDQDVTLNEAVKGILYLLGYTSDDFSGDQFNKRMSKYSYLDLSENLDLDAYDNMTKEDCINIFYNLLKCYESGTTTAYVTELDGELTDDGEVNALTLADNSIKGPKLITSSSELDGSVPFDMGDANLFMNGEASSYSLYKQALAGSGFLVYYYSSSAKTVWAYDGSSDTSDDDDTDGMGVVRGEVTNIYYQSSSTLTPSSVTIDDDGNTYTISSSDMQFAFSIYGSIQVGDEVALIYKVSTDSDGDETYTVTDYVED